MNGVFHQKCMSSEVFNIGTKGIRASNKGFLLNGVEGRRPSSTMCGRWIRASSTPIELLTVATNQVGEGQ